MWTDGWRDRFRTACEQPFDLLIIGGGITGAGIALEAGRAGLRVALVEQNDFASGTSSASSKLVHGGLRYLATGDWRLTRESVREREALMQDLPGLVDPIDFMLPLYRHDKPGRWPMRAALGAYDVMARHRYSHYLKRPHFVAYLPYLRTQALKGGFVYRDAVTDDVRLTLRVLGEAAAAGVQAANYVRADTLLRDGERVNGARLYDAITEDHFDLQAHCVVNATGPWSDHLRGQVSGQPQLRPLRGSHFVFPFHVLPVARAVTLFHPDDRRPLFALPWQGATLFGTTDLDHQGSLDAPIRMSEAESRYLIQAARYYFPSLDLAAERAVASFAGVRPVIAGNGGGSASDESRESAIDVEQGLVSVTGGKLTTFRVTAGEALEQIVDVLGTDVSIPAQRPIQGAPPESAEDSPARRRAGDACANPGVLPDDDTQLASTDYCLRELRFALAFEAVEHLDDLLLRRTRIGLLLAEGGAEVFDRVETICCELLGWDDTRWRDELDRYRTHWRALHAPT